MPKLEAFSYTHQIWLVERRRDWLDIPQAAVKRVRAGIGVYINREENSIMWKIVREKCIAMKFSQVMAVRAYSDKQKDFTDKVQFSGIFKDLTIAL